MNRGPESDNTCWPRVRARAVAVIVGAMAIASSTAILAAIPDANGVFHAGYAKSGAVSRFPPTDIHRVESLPR